MHQAASDARGTAFGMLWRREVQGLSQARRHACKEEVSGQAAHGAPAAALPAQHPRKCPAARRERRPMRRPRPARCRRARPTHRRCRPRCPSRPRGGPRRGRESAALTPHPAPPPPAGAPRAPHRQAPRAGAPRREGPACPPTAGALPGRHWPCPGAHPPRWAAAAARSPPRRTRRSRAARHGRTTGHRMSADACRPHERRPCARGGAHIGSARHAAAATIAILGSAAQLLDQAVRV